MNSSHLVKEVDEFVYDMELNGFEEEQILEAMQEYLEIVRDLAKQ